MKSSTVSINDLMKEQMSSRRAALSSASKRKRTDASGSQKETSTSNSCGGSKRRRTTEARPEDVHKAADSYTLAEPVVVGGEAVKPTTCPGASPAVIYDMNYPPLNIRNVTRSYTTMSADDWKNVHADFFTRIREKNDILTRGLLSCGMDFGEFSFHHLRKSHTLRQLRDDAQRGGGECE
jgi:hypothetical protein